MAEDFEAVLARRAWDSPEFAAQLESDAVGALADIGVTVPDGVEVEVVVQQPDTLYFVVPPANPEVADRSDYRLPQMDLWGCGSSFVWVASTNQDWNILALRNSIHDMKAEASE